MLDLRVDGLIFDHVADVKEEYSATENLFICKLIGSKAELETSSLILAEEREELEVLNSCRQKQLELQHRQLLQELERLKSGRETSTSSSLNQQLSKTLGNGGQEQSLMLDANFKHLM